MTQSDAHNQIDAQIESQIALDALTQAAYICARKQPWENVTLGEIAAGAEVSLQKCAHLGIGKIQIEAALERACDDAMLRAMPNIDHAQSVKERLFDVMMARFDVLEDDRLAWVSILAGQNADLIGRASRQARRLRTSAWALEAAGVDTSSTLGLGRVAGVAAIFARVEEVWVKDDVDLAKTMAKLDRLLSQAEAQVTRFWAVANRLGIGKSTKAPTTPDADAQGHSTETA